MCDFMSDQYCSKSTEHIYIMYQINTVISFGKRSVIKAVMQTEMLSCAYCVCREVTVLEAQLMKSLEDMEPVKRVRFSF